MARRLLARRLARTGGACATVAVLAGCTQAATTGTAISGSTLTIYISVPPGAVSAEAQDVIDAEKLAFSQTQHRVGKFTLKLEQANEYELSQNARRAITAATTIAYLGEIAPGASADTIGITNGEDVLQVSPTDTAVELTRSSPAIPNTPGRYYESLSTNGRTFARVVPNSALEAAAIVSQVQTLGVKRVYVVSDGSEYGRALRAAFVSRAGSAITVAGSATGVDAVLYAGSSAGRAAQAFDAAVSSSPKAALFAPSALDQDSFAASLSPAAQRRLYVSSPGFKPGAGPAPEFFSAFRNTYGHAPATQAIFGFAAMQAVIHALQQAGASASTRKTVVQRFFAIRNFGSAVGAISVTKDGDVSFSGGAPFVFSRVKAGKLVAERAVQEQG